MKGTLMNTHPTHLDKLSLRSAATAAILAIVAGCSEADRASIAGTVPLSGTVKLDGQPLANATLTFVPASGATEVDAGAETDETGRYEIKSDGGRAEGAKPGSYRVVVSRLVRPDGTVAQLTPDKSPMELMVTEQAKETVPAKYSDFMRTTLQAQVPEQGGTQDFELTSR